MTDYVVFHFRKEEDYLAKFAHSNALVHKVQLEQLVKNFLTLKERLMKEGINVQLADDMKQLVVGA